MSQAHIERIAADLLVGDDRPSAKFALPSEVLGWYKIPANSVAQIPPEFEFVPKDDYCPISDVPFNWFPPSADFAFGVHLDPSNPNKIAVIGDNGMSAFVFFLVRLPPVGHDPPREIEQREHHTVQRARVTPMVLRRREVDEGRRASAGKRPRLHPLAVTHW